MKKLLYLIFAVTAIIVGAFSASAASLSPALEIIAGEYEMTVSGLCDETVIFSGEQFAAAAGADSYESVRITSLPDKADGTLYYYDGTVSAGQVIPFDKADKLSFEPCEGAKDADFNFTFDGSYTMTCAIKLEASVNKAPTAGGTPQQYTLAGTVCTGNMRATDPDGDSLTFEVVEYPENGKLVFDKKSGDFTYTPGSFATTDKFVYRVKDEMGATSSKSEVKINVSSPAKKLTFADMNDSSYVAAAVTVSNKGLMTFTEKDDKLYFEPTEEVSRLDFLISAMNTFGASNLPTVSSTGFDDDEDIPEQYKSYVYSAKKLGIVKGIEKDGKCCFSPDKAITLAEASVILNNIIGYSANSGVQCSDTVPAWAKDAVDAVYELGITELSGGKLGASEALTKDKVAQIFYNLSNLMYE